MKWFFMALAGILPVVVVWPALASEGEEGSAPAPTASPQVVVLRSLGDAGEGAQHMVVEVDAEASDGAVLIHADPVMITSIAEPADPNRGWLGVQLGEVPPALAAHLRTAGASGVMVGNVVKGSPADQAGVQQYDVITTVDGKSVTGVAKLAEIIGSVKPQSKVAIKVLREGAEQTLRATLTSRPGGEEIEWKYELAPDAEIREHITTRGKILRRDEDGNFKLEDLGDLEALKNLPEDIKAFMPRMDELNTKIWTADDNRSFTTSVSRDGTSVTVKQDSGGPIVVERTDNDGKTAEATYADAEALKAADEEAHEIYEEAQSGAVAEPGSGAWRTFQFKLPGGHLNFQGHEEWREQMDQAMREAREAMKDAQKSVDDTQKRFQFRFKKVPGHPFFSWNEEGDGAKSLFSAEGRSFRVNPDGQIEVIIRKGDSEVTKVFKDEADLAERDPQLHEAYTATLSDDEE